MTVAQVVLNEYAWIGGWWLFTLLVGAAAMGRIGTHAAKSFAPPNMELALFFSMTAGIALQIFVLIGLALAGLLTVTAATLVFAVMAVLAARTLRLDWRRSWLALMVSSATPATLAALLPVLLLIAAWLVRPLGPGMGSDELSYHLPYARFYVEQGGLAVQEYLRFPLHAHNFNMLYTLAMMRDSITMAHGMHATAGFVTMLGLHGLARHWLGPLPALLAVVLFSLMGTLHEAFGNAFVDLGLVLFATASMFALALWQEGRDRHWLLLAGAFLGCAIGTKYYGLILTVPLGLWVLAVNRRPSDLARFTAVVCLFGLFWYLRSWLISGNPLHPFLGDWFGHSIWRPEDLASQHYELAEHGVARTPWNFVSLPFQLQFDRWAFHGRTWGDGVLVGLFYLGLLGLPRGPVVLRTMALVALAWLTFWFCTAQVMRYLLPIAPVMALTGASLLAVLGKRIGGIMRQRWPNADFRGRLPGWLRLSLVALTIAGARWHADLNSVAVTPQRQDAYLRLLKDGYELFREASGHPAIGAGPVLQFGLAGSYYYFDGVLYGDWTGHYAYTRFMTISKAEQWRLLPPAELRSILLERGIRGVVFSRERMGMFHPLDVSEWTGCFELVFENRYGTVMVPRPEPGSCA